jgi:hypothetical protein
VGTEAPGRVKLWTTGQQGEQTGGWPLVEEEGEELGVPVQSMRKVPISLSCKINELKSCTLID